MRIHRTLQLLVALAIGTTVVVVGPLPSGAITGTVSSGTLTVSTSPQLTSSLAPAATPCPGSSPISLDLVATTLTIGGDPFSYGGATYFLTYAGQTEVTLDAGTMTVGPFLPRDLNIYPETSPGSCTMDASAPLCLLGIDLVFPFLTLSGPWTGTTATLSGTAGTWSTSCSAPFSGVGGKTLTITDMVVDF